MIDPGVIDEDLCVRMFAGLAASFAVGASTTPAYPGLFVGPLTVARAEVLPAALRADPFAGRRSGVRAS